MSKVPWETRYEGVRELFESHGIDDPGRVFKYCLLSPQRIAGIIRACDAVKKIDGATAEIGCASGGTTRLIALLCKRKRWACDTFEGLVDVGDSDENLENGDFANHESTLAGVTERAFDLPNVTVIKGRFPDCAPAGMNGPFSLVHIDTDTYQSMRDCFGWFRTKVPKGGIVILDDVIGRGTTGGKLFWEEVDKTGWEVVEENDPHVIIKKV